MSPDRTEIRNLSSELENLTRQALESHSKAQAKSFLDRILFMEDQIALSPYLRNIFHEFYAQLNFAVGRVSDKAERVGHAEQTLYKLILCLGREISE